MTEQIQLTISDQSVATISFANPPHNAMTSAMLSELTEAINNASEDSGIKVIVVQSLGERAFCAGASFEELMQISNEEEGKAFFSGFANVINAIRKCKKVVIGQVQGKAVGGGVGLAAAFDLCYATKFGSIKLSEINIGIGPFVIGPAVTRKLSVSAFGQLSLCPEEFKTADWALNQGLYTKVFEDFSLLNEAVIAKAIELSKANPEALSKLKQAFWEGCEDWDNQLSTKAAESGRLVLSDFTQRALAKFK